MTLQFQPITPRALLVRFGESIDPALGSRISQLSRTLPRPGITDLVPSYTTLLIHYQPEKLATGAIRRMVLQLWNEPEAAEQQPPRHHIIPVVYGGEFGPDLQHVADNAGISTSDVVQIHSAGHYTVGALGFAPGFGFLTGLPAELTTPRHTTPRLRVPAGSVAIGGKQTGIYPVESSGGWNLIGRTNTVLFDPDRDDPILFRNGDTVTFSSVARLPELPPEPARRSHPHHRGLLVQSRSLHSTIQDSGRYGFADQGISSGGALDQSALELGNRLVGNVKTAAVLEMTLTGPTLRARQGVTIAVTGDGPSPRINSQPVARNRAIHVYLDDEISFEPDTGGARGYLAVAGGFDVPVVLGSRSTDVQSKFGGLYGRPVEPGDVLPIGSQRGQPIFAPAVLRARDRTVVRVYPGPQRDHFSHRIWNLLLSTPYRVTADANRIGVRLQGAELIRTNGGDMISEGITIGSIQVPGSGQPIVLLRACATIGGYPKIATVIKEDLDLCAQWNPGDQIRFREVSI